MGWDSVRRAVAQAHKDDKERRQVQLKQMRAAFRTKHGEWLRQIRNFLPRLLLCCALYTAGWAQTTGRRTYWWRTEIADRGMGPLRIWGPFEVKRVGGSERNTPIAWIDMLLCTLLSAAASAWVRVGPLLDPARVEEIATAQAGPAFVAHLETVVSDLLNHELQAHWLHPSVVDALCPASFKKAMFSAAETAAEITMCSVGRFLLRTMTNDESGNTPWDLLLQPLGKAGSGDDASGVFKEVLLEPDVCHSQWYDPSSKVKPQYRRFYEQEWKRGWRPNPDAVRLEMNTFLPVTSEPVRLAAPPPTGHPGPLTTARTAADMLMLMA